MKEPTQTGVLCFAAALLAAFVVGCGSGETRFSLDELAIAQQQIVPGHRQQIAEVLSEVLGSPDEPRVPDELDGLVEFSHLVQAAGPVAVSESGVPLGLFRRHCATCHGITGDGQGPASLYQTPYPRDFRQGVFKYKSTYRGHPPTDNDLAATLRHGLAGTAMPAFEVLNVEQTTALIDYVKYLAIRGQLEQALVRYVGEELDFDPATGEIEEGSQLDWRNPDTRELVLDELLEPIARKWRSPQVVPVGGRPTNDAGELAKWAEAGKVLFHDEQRANCAKCHGPGGKGGVPLNDFDDWSKRRHEFIQRTDRVAASLQTLEGELAAAALDRKEFLVRQRDDLTQEVDARRAVEQDVLPPRGAVSRRLVDAGVRGPSNPEDLFRRIHQGIAGTPMPAVGASEPGGDGALTDEEVWKLVAYLQQITTGTEIE